VALVKALDSGKCYFGLDVWKAGQHQNDYFNESKISLTPHIDCDRKAYKIGLVLN
jgi:phosphoglycerate dehydrogenase-like enzyme